MPRLLTDEHARQLAHEGAVALTRRIDAEKLMPLAHFNLVREAIEHDLAVTLEGLMEPEEGGGS